jgi:hypothetical protein
LLKKIGLTAAAAVAVLALGTAIFGSTPSANADTTDVLNINCLLILDDSAGGAISYTNAGFDPCTELFTSVEIDDLANQIGDEDGDDLEPSDFEEFDGYDGNQLRDTCTTGSFCTNLIFAFVDDEKPVTLDTPAGLTSIQAGFAQTDAVCDTDNDGTTLDGDYDCSDPVASNGDGVVVFHVVNFNAERGDELSVIVEQEAVENSVDVNVVGSPNDVTIVLAEDTIGESGSVSAANACADNTDVTDAVGEPNATTALVTVYDEDDRELAMIGLDIRIDPPSEDPDIATLGNNDDIEDITGDTSLTIDTESDLGIGYFRTICGGAGPGETVVRVQIDDGDADTLTDDDTDTADLTVVGLPDAIALTASPASIQCDGINTSTVTAKVTDSDGNNVANDTEVVFSVVALGTANPIDTETTDGSASSVITPLANASAGTTVIVSSGDVTTSIRVDCALPLVTQPTLTPPGQGPGGVITPPDTGNGGYLAQDGSSVSLMTLVALALAGAVVAAGGLVTRRAK